MPIEFHSEAQAEFDDAFDWYANQSSDAALAFMVGVDRAIALIVDAPERWERIDSRHRRCRVQRFPYSVVYRHDRDEVEIVGIVHASRRPGYWRNR